LAFAVVFLSGCAIGQRPSPTPTPDLVGTMVAATMAALPSPTPPLPTATPVTPTIMAASPTPATGNVTGVACYPTGASAMTAYFENMVSHVTAELALSGGQASYTIDLPPATYTAYAWLNDFSQAGSYSKCGADASCSDARPLPFEVSAGSSLTGIDLCDWSHGPFDIPYPPGHSVQTSTGDLSGSISHYPYGNLPVLTVVAFNQGTGYWYYIRTAAGQASYAITDILPPGSYQAVAYDDDGHAGGSDIVSVTVGQMTTANISDWGGGYPENPVH
jgi:hypothetical protein